MKVGAGAKLRNVIIDKGVEVPPGDVIGHDADTDRERFGDRDGCVVTDEGLVVIGKGERLAD